ELTGVGAGVQAGEPAELRGARLPREAVVPALVRLPRDRAGDLAPEGDGPVVGVVPHAAGALAHAVDVLAVVGVAGGVDDVADRVHAVGVPVAVVEPVHLPVVPARGEDALPRAPGTAEGPAAAVDVGAVGGEGVDGPVGRPVADVGVGLEGEARAGDGVDHA